MLRRSANVIELFTQTQRHNGLTIQDRIHALRWGSAGAAQDNIRVAIHPREGDAPESTDFVSIYRGNQRFAAFNAARTGNAIDVWRSATGRVVGRFNTMHEALAAVTAEAGQ